MRNFLTLPLVILLFFIGFTASAQKRLAIVGSSTSACQGPSVPDSCYVNRLGAYYNKNKKINPDTVIDNSFSLRGNAVYAGMPTSYIPPYTAAGLQPDPLHNITAALASHPDVILVNFPSNGYDSLPIANIMFCLRTIRDVANQAGVPCYVTTSQPRTSSPFATSAAKRKLAEVKDSVLLEFGSYAIDFYTGLINADSSIRYEADNDGTHMNNTGHDSLFRRVLRKNVFVTSTAFPVPPCVTNTAPSNGTTIASQTTTTLTWAGTATATSYDVYLWAGSPAPTVPTASVTTTSYTTASLTGGLLYNWYIVPRNASGAATGCGNTNKTSFTTAPATTGSGLQGTYYSGIALSGTPLLTRLDPTINFSFSASPAPGIVPADGYSVRWTGQVKPLFSETYTFYTQSDDGIRLWINGVQLVDNWVNQGTTEKSGTITLVAGQLYDVKIEYFENVGDAVTKLLWSSASTPKAIVPQSQLFPTPFTPPPIPACAVNISPADGGTVAAPISATLAWNAVNGATAYDVYIWTGPSAPASPVATTTTASYAATGLTASTLYNWYVVPKNATGNATGCGNSNKTTFTTASTAAGSGLQGVYYNGTALAGTPILTRIDPTVNFVLAAASPAPGIVPQDNFSVRWTGQVKPLFSETYTFYTQADDGIRLWVNGVQLVDNWVNQGTTEKSGTIALVAGQLYDVKIEYFEGTGDATASFLWSSASTPKAVVPQSQLFPAGSTAPAIPTCGVNISPADGSSAPVPISATLVWNAVNGATSYDVYIWTGSSAPALPVATTTTATYTATGLTASTVYNWYVVPKNATGNATGCGTTNKTSFSTASSSAGSGLQGVYYNGTAVAGTPLLTRIDPTVNFVLGTGSPAPGTVPADGYSVRWTGQVKPLFSETYTFYTQADDGIRLWVNGVQLVDNWVNQGTTEMSGTIALVAGQLYDVKIEYFEGTGDATASFLWSSASTPKAVVPQSQLFPSGATVPPAATSGLQGVYYNGITLSGTPLLTRIDPTVNFVLGAGSPAPGTVPADGYSVRWTGQVKPLFSETYTFYTQADDGIRLWVNGVQLVDNWVNQGTTEKSGNITLVAGQLYDVKIEYYENAGDATASFLWSSASTPKAIVPQSQLFPPAAANARIAAATQPVPALVTGLSANRNSITATASPNPVRPGKPAILKISSGKMAAVVVNIINSNGAIVRTQRLNLAPGINTAMLSTFSLSQGLYIINITGADRPLAIKILVE